jgi:Na+/melibiose symporter-like transporter
MDATDDLIPCPGGCGNQLHANARECPHCGYQSEMSRLEDLLGSLGTICSILTGFGLAALVQLATGESRKEWALRWTTGVWIVSSLLLLGVLVCSETLRRRDVGGGRMRLSREEEHRLWRRSEWLLLSFSLALLGTAVGVVLLGFFFSPWHGVAGCVAVAIGFFLLWKTA